MKKVLSMVLVIALCLSLCACVSKEDVVGTWVGSWTYNGNSFYKTFALEMDGTYTSVILKNGEMHDLEEGTYEVKGKNVNLHPDGDENSTTPFKYKDGSLYNGDHEFVKE